MSAIEIVHITKALRDLAMSYFFRKSRMTQQGCNRVFQRLEGIWPEEIEV